jgi:2-polyprenyl-3-methyl-5-hydroxy-6-metoxy-1,4-benzoquinol methylase
VLHQAISQLCTQAQCESPQYAYWCEQIRETPRLHRKQWEYCYILQVLEQAGMLAEGRRGMGFGVGREPLTAVMAARGCSVLASDMSADAGKAQGWIGTNQHASELAQLNERGICDEAGFNARVRYRTIDMNNLPSDEGGFDFLWSSCALEHLGSLQHGLDYIERSLALLRPGGLAVHTTEYNVSSNFLTLSRGGTVLFRQRDILGLADRLRALGHRIEFNLHPGNDSMDKHIDVPPYCPDPHLKLRVSRFTATSIGLAIHKAV